MKIIAHEVEVLEIPGIWFMEIFARVCKIVDVEWDWVRLKRLFLGFCGTVSTKWRTL